MDSHVIVEPQRELAVDDVERLFGPVVDMDRNPTGTRRRAPVLSRECGVGTAVEKGDVEPQQGEPLTLTGRGPTLPPSRAAALNPDRACSPEMAQLLEVAIFSLRGTLSL